MSTVCERNGLREFALGCSVVVMDDTSDVSTNGATGAGGNGHAPGRPAEDMSCCGAAKGLNDLLL